MSPSSFRTDIRNLLSLVRGHRVRFTLLALGATVPHAFLSIGIAFGMKQVVDYFTLEATTSLGPAVLVAGCVVVGVAVVSVLTHLCSAERERILRDVRLRLISHLASLPVATFERMHSGDVLTRVNKDTDELQTALGAYEGAVGSVGALVPMIPYLLLLDWRFGAIGILASTVAALIINRSIAPMRAESGTIHVRTAELSEAATEAVTGFDVIKSFGLSRLFRESFEGKLESVADASHRRTKIEAKVTGAGTLVARLNEAVLAVVGCNLVITGTMEVGVLVGSLSICLALTEFIAGMSGRFVALQRSLAGADRLRELFEQDVEPRHLGRGRPLAGRQGSSQSAGSAALTFESVSFRYPTGSVALRDVSLSVPAGETAALVGHSGGGKSTLMKLALGLYDGWDGEIEILGVPAPSYPLEQWRELVAYVPQDAYIFDGTIRENIEYGQPGANREQVEAAARSAFAHEFILSKPDGYETQVGERGIRLSGGERQRVAIARAILKDAPILLLDEATASLDTQSEEAVQTALAQLMVDRTTLVIAHRLSTVEHADRIYVLSEGRVVEAGSHQELLAAGGVYRGLHAQQLRD